MSYSRATTEDDLRNILNEVLPSTSVDYVVEQGTSGNWTYRKWNSGIAECWQTINAGSKAMTSASGSGYYAAESTYSFPSGLFNTAPTITLGAYKNGGLGGFAISSASASNFKGYWWDTASVTRTVYLYVHAYGTWK